MVPRHRVDWMGRRMAAVDTDTDGVKGDLGEAVVVKEAVTLSCFRLANQPLVSYIESNYYRGFHLACWMFGIGVHAVKAWDYAAEEGGL